MATDVRLFSLLRDTGQADGLSEDAFANLQHVPLFQHFSSVLTVSEHYVSPEDAELAKAQAAYDDDPGLADRQFEELLQLYHDDPETFAAETAAALDLRETIELNAKQDKMLRQGDDHLARTRSHVVALHEGGQTTRLQQQQAEQALARQTRAVEHQAAAAATRNAADNRAVQEVQALGRSMQGLLHKSPEEWLLTANPLEDLRHVEKLTMAEVAKAKDQLSPAQLARRVAEQQAEQGATPDTPFAPSATRMLAGLGSEQYAAVLGQAEAMGNSGRLLRDQKERQQAELAGLQRQAQLLELLAKGELPTVLDPAAEQQLKDEAEELRLELSRIHDSDDRQSLLDQVASVSMAQVKRAIWLLRHQQLGYMTQLQRQLLEVFMQQWARVEVVQMVRADERRSLTDLWATLQSVSDELGAAVRSADGDAAECRALTGAAEQEALLASDRGPQALLGSDAALCAQFTLFDNMRQLTTQLAGQATQGLGTDRGGLGGAEGREGIEPASSLSSSLTSSSGARNGASSAFGGLPSSAAAGLSLGGAGGGGGNAFLDSVMAEPSQRTVSQLAAVVDGVAGQMARLDGQLQSRVCDTLSQMVDEGRNRVEDARQMLAAPPASASAPPSISSISVQWPVLRDPAYEAELAATRSDVERVAADIQSFAQRTNMLWEDQKNQSEQARLERGVLSGFWTVPERLLRDVQALRDRLGALLAAAQ